VNSPPLVEFFVPGIVVTPGREPTPVAGGSKKAIPVRRGRGGPLVIRDQRIAGGQVFGTPMVNVTDDAKGNDRWKKAVELVAAVHWRPREPLDRALHVEMTFYLPRPANHHVSSDRSRLVKPTSPRFPTVRPDVLKLARSTEDAISGVVWRDDCSTCALDIRKFYAPAGTGVLVRVWELTFDAVESLGAFPW